MCMVTVLMTVYNGEKYLIDSVTSILNQTYQDFEFLVIDDGSSDESREVIRSFDDGRIRLIVNDKNIGCVKSLNKGIKEAKGKYIAKFDQDDISHPKRLEEQVRYMEQHENVVLLGTRNNIIQNGEIKTAKKGILDYVYSTRDIRFGLIFGNYTFVHSSYMFRKSTLLVNNIYYEIETQDDYDIIGRLIQVGDVEKLNAVLVTYRLHDNQQTAGRPTQEIVNLYDCVKYNYMRTFVLLNKLYLKKGVFRKLKTVGDVWNFNKELAEWAVMNELDNKSLRSGIFDEVIKGQYFSLGLYLGCLFVKKNPFAKICLIVMAKLILGYNKYYIPSNIYCET